MEEVVEPSSMWEHFRVKVPIQSLDVASFPRKGDKEDQEFEIYKMSKTKLCFHSIEKMLQLGGKSYDFKHKGRPR